MSEIKRTALVGFTIVTALGRTEVPINNFNFSALLDNEDKPIGPDIGVYTGVMQFQSEGVGYFWVAASIELKKAEDGTAVVRHSTLVDSTYPGELEVTEIVPDYQTVTRQVNEAFELVWSMVEFTEMPNGDRIAQLHHKDGRKAALTINKFQVIEKIHLEGKLVFSIDSDGKPEFVATEAVKEIQHNFFVQRYSEAMFRVSAPTATPLTTPTVSE